MKTRLTRGSSRTTEESATASLHSHPRPIRRRLPWRPAAELKGQCKLASRMLTGVAAHSAGGGVPPGAHQSVRSRSHAVRRRPLELDPAATSTPIDRNRRVLVVEDERTIRRSIAGYLGDAG